MKIIQENSFARFDPMGLKKQQDRTNMDQHAIQKQEEKDLTWYEPPAIQKQ